MGETVKAAVVSWGECGDRTRRTDKPCYVSNASNGVGSERSFRSKSGSHAASSSRECHPVHTATARAPIARAQRTSSGVSPMTQSCSGTSRAAQMLVDDLECLAGHVVTVEVQIAIAAEDEVVIELEEPELDLGPCSNIARQKAEQDILPAAQLLQQCGNSRKYLALPCRQVARQVVQVGIEQPLQVRRRVVDGVMVEKNP